MPSRKFLIYTAATLLIFSCGTHKPAFKGIAWEKYPSAATAGFDEAKLADLTNYIDESARTTGLVAIYKGKIVYTYGDVEKISYIASCRKSVLSMLYGRYVDDGTIDLNTTIGELGIEEKDGLLPLEKKATVDNIITSRSGVFHVASNGGYDKDNFLERGSVQPGEYWVYNNWDFNVAGAIFEQYAGKLIYRELEEQMAKPLGFQDWNIENQRKSGKKSKSQYKAYHIYLSTRDMAKIGQLMLNKGYWKGEQLISESWIRKTTSTVTPSETLIKRFGPADPNSPLMSYGYMWWLFDDFKGNPAFTGAYTAVGYGGQWITVLPAVDLVVAHKTKLDLLTMIGISYHATDGKVYDMILEMLVAALEIKTDATSE